MPTLPLILGLNIEVWNNAKPQFDEPTLEDFPARVAPRIPSISLGSAGTRSTRVAQETTDDE